MEGSRYSIEFLPGASRQFAKLPRVAQLRIDLAINRLAAEPRPSGARLLSGGGAIWRLRIGDYRVLYQIEVDRLIVLVIGLGHRREVHRGQR